MSKKQTVIARLYDICKARGNFAFTNDEVREVAVAVDFKNHFDATKIDNSAGLPTPLVADDAFVVHLGRGRHQFVFGIAVAIIGSSRSRKNSVTSGPIGAAS